MTTGKEYRGINILVLGACEFTSRYWTTYREAQRLGGHVLKGERATPVIYWKWRTPQELAQRREMTGCENPAPCVPFVSAVFNLDQVDGVPRPEDDIPNRTNDRFDVAEQMLTVMPDKPEIIHTATREPSYSPRRDCVTLPHLSQFESGADWFSNPIQSIGRYPVLARGSMPTSADTPSTPGKYRMTIKTTFSLGTKVSSPWDQKSQICNRIGDGVSRASESIVGSRRQSHYSNPIFLRFR